MLPIQRTPVEVPAMDILPFHLEIEQVLDHLRRISRTDDRSVESQAVVSLAIAEIIDTGFSFRLDGVGVEARFRSKIFLKQAVAFHQSHAFRSRFDNVDNGAAGVELLHCPADQVL